MVVASMLGAGILRCLPQSSPLGAAPLIANNKQLQLSLFM